MSQDEIQNISKYVDLIDKFLKNAVTAHEFERQFLDMHKAEVFRRSEESGTLLSKLFSAVDAFCDDPEIASYDPLDPFRDITENELREKAQSIVTELKDLISGSNG